MAKKVAALVASWIFWFVGTGLFLAAMLTESWTISLAHRLGLFKICFANLVCSGQGWVPIDQVPLAIFVPRILMLAAGALLVLGLIFFCIGLACKQTCLIITDGVLELVGGFIVFAACGAFTGLNYVAPSLSFGPLSVNLSSFGFSFYLGWVSGLMFIIAGITTIIAGKNYSSDY